MAQISCRSLPQAVTASSSSLGGATRRSTRRDFRSPLRPVPLLRDGSLVSRRLVRRWGPQFNSATTGAARFRTRLDRRTKCNTSQHLLWAYYLTINSDCEFLSTRDQFRKQKTRVGYNSWQRVIAQCWRRISKKGPNLFPGRMSLKPVLVCSSFPLSVFRVFH